MKNKHESITPVIGKTSLVFLKMSEGLPGTVWLKLENRNPGGSIKDRVAAWCIDRALDRGDLKPDGCIVAPTSGNMGIGIAMCAAARGLKCVIVMPESMSMERRKLLQGYGAQLVLSPAEEGMAGSVRIAKEIAEKEGAWLLDQFTNPDAVEAHYNSTGPELYYDTGGEIDALVAGVGSGSTITGAGRYLLENTPEFQIIAVEPAESPVLSGGQAGKHGIQGIGAGFVPEILDTAQINEIVTVETPKALETARELMRKDGICAGISTGANVWAALEVAKRPEMFGKHIVTFACDTGERYISTELYNQE